MSSTSMHFECQDHLVSSMTLRIYIYIPFHESDIHTSVCVCVRVQLVVHTGMGSHPLAGGQAGRAGSPVQRSSPTLPRQTYLRACPWILARIAWGASFHFHVHLIFVLCHSLCLAQPGQDPRPCASSSFCFAGMPFLVSGVPLEPNCHSPSLPGLSG